MRASWKQGGTGRDGEDDEEDDNFRASWRRRLLMALKLHVTCASSIRIAVFLLVLAAIVIACISLPVEKVHLSLSLSIYRNILFVSVCMNRIHAYMCVGNGIVVTDRCCIFFFPERGLEDLG